MRFCWWGLSGFVAFWVSELRGTDSGACLVIFVTGEVASSCLPLDAAEEATT